MTTTLIDVFYHMASRCLVSVDRYKATWRQIQESSNFRSHRHEKPVILQESYDYRDDGNNDNNNNNNNNNSNSN
jgi:hypothetical protein